MTLTYTVTFYLALYLTFLLTFYLTFYLASILTVALGLVLAQHLILRLCQLFFASCFPIMIVRVLEDEVISIFNAAVAAICVAHIITCLWFWIGSTVQVGPKFTIGLWVGFETIWIHMDPFDSFMTLLYQD